MKKNIVAVATLLFLTILCAPLMGEESVNALKIDEATAVAMALESNLSLQNASLTMDKAKRAKSSVWNTFLPSTSVTASLNRRDQLFTDVAPPPNMATDPLTFTPGVQMSLNLNAAVFLGLSISRLQYEAGLIDYEKARVKLEKDVKKAFYGLMTTQANLTLLEKNIQTAEKRWEQAQENFQNGLIPELNVLRARVAAENQKPNYNALKSQYRNSLMYFKLLLGLDREQDIVIDGDLDVTPATYDTDLLITRYIESRLDIKSLRKALELQEKSRDATFQLERTPSLTLSGQWKTDVSNPFGDGSWDNLSDSLSLTASVRIPIDGWIPGSKTSVKLKDADNNIEQAKLTLAMTIQNAEIEIATLVMDINNSQNTLATYALNVELAQKAYDMTTEAYNLGTKEFLEVESAQNDLLKAEQDVLLEKYKLLGSLFDLEYALNTPLSSLVTE